MPKNKKRPKAWHRQTDGKRYKRAMRRLRVGYSKIEKEKRQHKVWSFTPDGESLFTPSPCTCKIDEAHWNNGDPL